MKRTASPAPLRTRTGQTGPDAYVFTAAAIANAHREHLRRYRADVTALLGAMIREGASDDVIDDVLRRLPSDV